MLDKIIDIIMTVLPFFGGRLLEMAPIAGAKTTQLDFLDDKALKLINSSHTSTQSDNNVVFALGGKGDGSDPDEGGSGSGSGGSGEEKPGGGGVTPDPSV